MAAPRASVFRIMRYCNECGESHSRNDDCYALKKVRTMSTRGSTVAAKLAAQSSSKEEVTELTASFSTMTFEEREKRTKEAIEEVEAELRLADLEAKLQNLRDERDKLRRRTDEESKGAAPDVRVSTPAVLSGLQQTGLPPPSWEDGHMKNTGFSDYGRSRRHSRERHRRYSRSRSDSSESRRRRSKWLLKHHTVGGKEVRKLNAYELIAASSLWCLEIQNLNISDYRAFLEHIALLAIRAKDDYYKDSAHVDYVLAVRRAAEKIGFAAFSKEHAGDSVVHYGPQNMKQRRQSFSAFGKRRSPGPTAKRPCYAWNSDTGCMRTEDECRYSHTCAKCGSKSHKRAKCKD